MKHKLIAVFFAIAIALAPVAVQADAHKPVAAVTESEKDGGSGITPPILRKRVLVCRNWQQPRCQYVWVVMK